MITAEGEGVIDFVDATSIVITYDRSEEEEFVSFDSATETYKIPKFRRTNQNMTIDLRPICEKGQRVKKGDILTEGYATENGELAWAATCSLPTCLGRVTTMRMPSCSTSVWFVKTS